MDGIYKKNYTTRCFDEAAAVDDDDVDDSKAEGAGRLWLRFGPRTPDGVMR